jgi:aromatic ring-cleaving dioxygenase
MSDTRIDGYHIHVYYDDATRPRAENVAAALAENFGLERRPSTGSPNGPHPIPQYRLTVAAAKFQDVVPWLMLNHDDLDVLIHPLTDSSYDDHTKYAIWIGKPVALKTTGLRGYRPEQYPSAAG